MRFEKFGDYMYALLLGPLKKVRQSANQWYIFFKVVGRLFDRAKEDLFRVREESMIVTASEPILELHGLDRSIVRLQGESVESFRNRLALRYIIAAEAGTNEAIRYIAKAFGYDNVSIEPNPDPLKWAEVSVQFTGGKIVLDDRALLLRELNKIKPAGALLEVKKEQIFTGRQRIGTAYVIGKQITMQQR